MFGCSRQRAKEEEKFESEIEQQTKSRKNTVKMQTNFFLSFTLTSLSTYYIFNIYFK